VRARGDPGDRKTVDQPATTHARRGDGARDERGAGKREHRLAAVGLQDSGGLAEHHEACARGQREHREELDEDAETAVFGARRGRGRVDHACIGEPDQGGRREAGGEHDRREPGQRDAQSMVLDGPADHRRADHRAQGEQADHVAVHQAAHLPDRLVHALLHDRESAAAAESEQEAVAEHELSERGRPGGDAKACGADDAAEHEQRDRMHDPVEPRRDVHAGGEADRGDAEYGRHLGARDAEQRFHRFQEDAERVDGTQGQVERGGGRDRECRARPGRWGGHATILPESSRIRHAADSRPPRPPRRMV